MKVDPPTISELNRVDNNPELIDVVSVMYIGETQQQKSTMASSVPVEEERVGQESRYERVSHIESTVKD